MEFWNQIVQTAVIGTEKKQIDPNTLASDFAVPATTIIENTTIDREERFLQVATLAFSYRQSGFEPLHKPNISTDVCPEETKYYCSDMALQTLKDILFEDSNSLLKIWLKKCNQHQQIIHPSVLPDLLNKAVQQKNLREDIVNCCGNRGKWLMQFNKDWCFGNDITDIEQWNTGTTEQRKKYLISLRETDSSKAIDLLQEVWTKENAATKQSLLEALEINLSAEDISWLESIAIDKSQKVKDEVLRLLKKIPSSTIMKAYFSLVAQSLHIRKEKTMFGLSSKQILEIKVPENIDESIFKSGIEKLSNRKEFNDDEFIVYQLLQQIPPTFIASHFQLSAEDVIQFFQKEDGLKKWMPALVTATVQFNDKKWAIALMQHSQVFYLDILPLIPAEQQEYYSKKFFKGNEHSIIQYALNWQTEWSIDLTKMIISYTAANHYNYYRSFYNHYIHLIPAQVISILEACTPTEEYAKNSWINTSEYINKLISLKQQISQSFK
ncbi:MAG: DUF5691 domain-containing protein [Chitinophagaceae bacterium]